MELIKTEDSRNEALIAFLRLLAVGPVPKATHERYKHVLESATPVEANAAMHDVLSSATDLLAWEGPVARFLRALSASLDRQALPVYPEGHLLAALTAENIALSERFAALAGAVKKAGSGPVSAVAAELKALAPLVDHYVRLQNELFPLFEEAFADHACVKLMWTLEDKAIALRKTLLGLGKEATLAPGSGATRALGAFFLIGRSLLWREERILYPVAWRVVSPDRFAQAGKANEKARTGLAHALAPAFACATGSLSEGELAAIFKVLPVDVSFIGADDRVKFYSDPPHRVFPRSPAVVGRLVQNCHPPKSVATVEKILHSFREGSRDREEFWLSLGGRFIHIEYVAVRSEGGEYLGTLEVSSDATALRALEGEKRLL